MTIITIVGARIAVSKTQFSTVLSAEFQNRIRSTKYSPKTCQGSENPSVDLVKVSNI